MHNKPLQVQVTLKPVLKLLNIFCIPMRQQQLATGLLLIVRVLKEDNCLAYRPCHGFRRHLDE